jgi:hypothetical protein
VNALCDALSEAGVVDLPMPVTAEALWRVIRLMPNR